MRRKKEVFKKKKKKRSKRERTMIAVACSEKVEDADQPSTDHIHLGIFPLPSPHQKIRPSTSSPRMPHTRELLPLPP